jgi:hypothetical protein
MKRIIRLTESDLVRLVKRVINEQPVTDYTRQNFSQGFNGTIIPVHLSAGLATTSRGEIVLTSAGNTIFKVEGNVNPNGKLSMNYLKVKVTADKMSDFIDRMNLGKLPVVNGQKIDAKKGDILYFIAGESQL